MSSKSHISGAVFERPDDMPVSLSAYVQSLVESYPNGIFTEIDKKGKAQTITYLKAHLDALKICAALNENGLQSGLVF